MAVYVKDEGAKSARFVLIGEAPGKHENAQGRPFVGPSGFKLMNWWRDLGLTRSDFYITNVYPYQPPHNNLKAISHADLAPWRDDLHRRVADLTDPVVLVPTGNTALQALVGKVGITKHRGSIYQYMDRRGRPIKVIPTIHPAALFRQPAWERRCVADWRRIRDDAEFRDLRTPEREHFIAPTLSDVRSYVEDVKARAEVLAIDIETPRTFELIQTGTTKLGKPKWKKTWGTPRIKCLAFCFEPHFTLSIPTTEEYWHDQLPDVWALIAELCSLPCAKALQNGLFDAYYLAEDHGIPLVNWVHDTRWEHATLDPLDDHDLAYMASIDTRQPFWKDEAKDPDEIQKYASNFEALLTYNGIDAAVTHELAGVYDGRLANQGRTRFYDRHYRRVFPALLSLMRHGITLDDPGRKLAHARLAARCCEFQDALTGIAGEPLYGKKDLSVKKLQKFLYETLRLPKQHDRQTGALTTKEVTVRKLMLRFPEKLGRDNEPEKAGRLILDHRRYSKLTTFIKDGVPDPDGRVRCQYGFTYTGRLTSSRNPKRTGQNLQNVDRELRHLYRPDPGCFFLEADLSQAESRIVYCLSGDPHLITYALAKPWKHDDHRRTAAIVFAVAPEFVTKEQRYFGKHTRHAAHYGEGGNKMSESLLKEGYVRDPGECTAWLANLLAIDKGILDWQRDVRKLVLHNRMLANSWGRIVNLESERLGDDLYRLAYAWQPQSEVGDLTNQWGLLPLWKWLTKHQMDSQINLQTHDSLTTSTTLEEGYDILCFLRESLERPRRYNGIELTIPVEFKCGLSWAMDIRFEKFPDEYEFRTRVKEMLDAKKK